MHMDVLPEALKYRMLSTAVLCAWLLTNCSVRYAPASAVAAPAFQCCTQMLCGPCWLTSVSMLPGAAKDLLVCGVGSNKQ